MDKLDGLDRKRVATLGMCAYYWRAESGKFQDTVIISAHGGIKKTTKEDLMIPQNYVLFYYTTHGATAGDFGINKFAAPTPPPHIGHPMHGGKYTYNYELSKYQGRHGNPAETYKSIQAQSTSATNHNNILNNLTDAERHKLAGQSAGVQKLYDVVTIRNRFFSSGSDLKTILEQIGRLRGQVSNNLVIHCFFCRSFF